MSDVINILAETEIPKPRVFSNEYFSALSLLQDQEDNAITSELLPVSVANNDGYESLLEFANYFIIKNFSVVPLDEDFTVPSKSRTYLSRVARFTDATFRKAFAGYHNYGIWTGQSSMNLFSLRCATEESYHLIQEIIGDNVKWVTKTGNRWDVWLLCGCGIVSNLDFCQDVKIFGHDEFIVGPGSNSLSGDTSSWILRESEFPGILYEEEMKEIFPKVIITSVKYKLTFSYVANISDIQTNDANSYSYTDQIYSLFDQQRCGKGRTGAGMDAVFKALLTRANLEDPNNFRASCREVETISGVSLNSVLKYITKLQRLGWIEIVEKSVMGTRYRICSQPKLCNNKNGVLNVAKPCSIPYHDVWSTHGLSKCGQRIFECLLNSTVPLSSRQVSIMTSISLNTVRIKLNKMQSFNLVQKSIAGWNINQSVFNSEKLDQIALEMGVKGHCQKKKERIQSDRNNFGIVLLRRNATRPKSRP